MTQANPKVDEIIKNATQWQAEYAKLRSFVLSTELTEEVKWGVPCYTYQGGNVVLIHGFKEYCAILFVKGALLKDAASALIQQTENVQAGRQIRFTSLKQIVDMEATIKAYLQEAIAIEKAGLKVEFKRETELVYPEEFEKELQAHPNLKKAFDALTPGRRRAYNLFFTAPKQSKTREARIEKSIPKILSGKGLDDF